jgi:outer membrane protein OmpA-like peptidoglycan-associated protein
MYLLCLVLIPVVLPGCSAVVLGLGAGAGAVAYSRGEIARTYEVEYHRAVDASMDTLHQLNIQPAEKMGDELKTEIRAIRADGSPVKVEVERIDSQRTQISIRTGAIGVLDQAVSNQIHEIIAKNLLNAPQLAEAPAEPATAKLNKTHQNQKSKEQTSSKPNLPEPAPKSEMNADRRAAINFPPLAAQELEKQTNAKYVIFFDQDSNRLQAKALEKLGEIASVMIANPDAKLTISGFSDAKGSPPYKKMLSEQRANTVKLYLVANGADPARTQIIVRDQAGDLLNQGAIVEVAY